ncbi:unnamed protein product [Phytophthora lilii]|uniref:Unnamed protein product n=1 Tax=Phytophthora lilii TaxID=2077276 RepID=A0A9W6YH60_9STRA|nr:unnamed protein product [Phytophthora lilii]
MGGKSRCRGFRGRAGGSHRKQQSPAAEASSLVAAIAQVETASLTSRDSARSNGGGPAEQQKVSTTI